MWVQLFGTAYFFIFSGFKAYMYVGNIQAKFYDSLKHVVLHHFNLKQNKNILLQL